jgi:hypothetical protein
MKVIYLLAVVFVVASCKEKVQATLSAQEIVDRSISACGGEQYTTNDIFYKFRNYQYASEWKNGGRILKRIAYTDSTKLVDVKGDQGFKRFVNDSLVSLKDSIANLYSNSVNSVHYFAYLPYGLNDAAVNKELLGEVTIRNKEYYKIKVTFDRQGGGKDYEDIYLYWFNKETFKPDYLAYKFYVDGGGIRFRAAYNERFVGGIRFVDYENYGASLEGTTFNDVELLYERNKLKLLSKIVLEDISVKASN